MICNRTSQIFTFIVLAKRNRILVALDSLSLVTVEQAFSKALDMNRQMNIRYILRKPVLGFYDESPRL